MTQCVRCQRVKFWFQMYSKFMGIYTATFPLCKACARQLTYIAVCDITERRPQPQSLVDRVAALEKKMSQVLPDLR